MIKTILCLFVFAIAAAAQSRPELAPVPLTPPGTTDAIAVAELKAENESLKAEISLLKAQNAWCQTELSIWGQNPEVMQVRLNLALESKKAAERAKAEADKAAAKAKPVPAAKP